MANLFFVFTPFQLFAAQQIVHSQGFENNILIEGYVTTNKHFLEIYDFMEIEGMWKEKHIIPDIEHWDGNRIKSIKDARTVYKKYKQIRKIAEDNHVETFFLGEIQNQTCRFTAVLFDHLGYKIAFFEDGMSHYMQRHYVKDNTIKTKVRVFFHDLLYYLPIYHVRFAQWRYHGSKPLNNEFPKYTRYSLIPFYNEKYDVFVKTTPLASNKIKKYVKDFIDNQTGTNNSVLLMTDPLNEVIPPQYMHCYFDTIKDSLSKLEKETLLYIKYHPREPETSKKTIKEIAESLCLRYKIISSEINIPVEYYLQYITFEKILFLNAATFFYNGYVFPKREFVSLLPSLRHNCIKNGAKKLPKLDILTERVIHGL